MMGTAEPTIQPQTVGQREYVRISESPLYFGFSRDTAYRAVKAGKLKIHKMRGMSFLKHSDVIKWMENEFRMGG